MQKLGLLQKLAEHTDLPGEIPPGMPVVEIAGEGRVLIERHNGMVEYSRERISVRVCYGTVCVCGAGLELSLMTKQLLVISGQINCVQVLRRRN